VELVNPTFLDSRSFSAKYLERRLHRVAKRGTVVEVSHSRLSTARSPSMGPSESIGLNVGAASSYRASDTMLAFCDIPEQSRLRAAFLGDASSSCHPVTSSAKAISSKSLSQTAHSIGFQPSAGFFRRNH
jgi:hypothetical protein